MTAIASVPLAPIGRLLQRETDTFAHRRLHMQLVPLDATEYTPEQLVSAVTDFCQARRAAGVPAERVMDECLAIATSRLDTAGVRLVEVLAGQSLVCPVLEVLDKYRSSAVRGYQPERPAIGN